MAALTQARDTKSRSGRDFVRGVKAATQCFQGGIACLNAAGYAVPGAVSATLKADGIFEESALGSAVDGEVKVRVTPGRFPFANSGGGDLITIADIGNDCYIVDDQTVAKTNGGATRSVAGKVIDIDAYGVWVKIGLL